MEVINDFTLGSVPNFRESSGQQETVSTEAVAGMAEMNEKEDDGKERYEFLDIIDTIYQLEFKIPLQTINRLVGVEI